MPNLYAHQQRILDDDPKKCGLFLGTGSGKTRIALMLARGKTLVIAPKTQVEDGNWPREWAQLKLGETVKNLHVISKERFRRDQASLGAYHTVIIDEAHTCLGVTPNTRWRNKKEIPRASQLFDALSSYLVRTNPSRLYLCTATILKSPMTVWGAAKVLGKLEKGDLASFLNFRQTFYQKLPMPGRDVYVPKATQECKDQLAAAVKSMGYIGRLEDFFDVPDQTFRTVHVDLTEAQKIRLKKLRTEYPDPIVLLGKRHQVENGVLAGDGYSSSELFDNNKVAKVLEYAEEFPKMVIFAKYRGQIVHLKDSLERAGYTVLTLTGDTPDRGTLLELANSLPACIFIAQAQISAGWELPDYPVMIFASRTYSFVDYDQALGRIHRANHLKKNLYINLVVKGGVDEAVDRSLANKSDFNERLYLNV